MDQALVLSALLMGLAGSLHCIGMCGAASAAAVRGCAPTRPRLGLGFFHLGRLLGYAAAGAVAATSVSWLAQLGQWSPALRPLWALAHMAALALGLWLLIQGRQPQWLDQLGRSGDRSQVQPVRWHGRSGSALRASSAGLAWVAWPCGLLQSALMVAALANSAVSGAAVMGAFALASALPLGLAPALWQRLAQGDPSREGRITRWAARLSGAALAGASAWALGHDLFVRFAAWCMS
ncbi:sulfite exporter TauE/SafE family protein [Ideonella sp. 4Y16]|uniref:Sulfite exporter TauE/SafE family protein n=1 Tax=Ideonella alba TaxID=2824118 RepID=A0A940Y6X7_9BURK|nr:sulfite exporter TauE/SafE family protein [Ideonella alba]MBQ0930982.1 sulfite exporter TauE/SafE family protein [Ideonella alba]MBQ0942354.1 sulfite exporter TauE/SafE family protein [Ideonella alba]